MIHDQRGCCARCKGYYFIHCCALQGSLPTSYSQLTQLEVLALDSRPDVVGLDGQLPSWAGTLQYGIAVAFDSNDFSGPIPQAWCSSGAVPTTLTYFMWSSVLISAFFPPTTTLSPATSLLRCSSHRGVCIQCTHKRSDHRDLRAGAMYGMSLTDNPGLCGTVPDCMIARLESLEGTAVIRPSDPTDPEGGYCASAAPTCSPNKGCRYAFCLKQGYTLCERVAIPCSDTEPSPVAASMLAAFAQTLLWCSLS